MEHVEILQIYFQLFFINQTSFIGFKRVRQIQQVFLKVHSQVWGNFWQMKALLKRWIFFISPKKLFWFWRYLNLCSDFLDHEGKRLDKRAKVNFKICDVTSRETNNYTYIAQYPKKSTRQ